MNDFFTTCQLEWIVNLIRSGLTQSDTVTIIVPIISGHPHKAWLQVKTDARAESETVRRHPVDVQAVYLCLNNFGTFVQEGGYREAELILTVNSDRSVETSYKLSTKLPKD